MFKSNALYFTVLLLLLTAVGTAQIKCTIVHYSTENGLSHNRIMCMLRDDEGFMWFGTWDGLNRFDGHNFVVYKWRPGDNSSLGSSRIQSIPSQHTPVIDLDRKSLLVKWQKLY